MIMPLKTWVAGERDRDEILYNLVKYRGRKLSNVSDIADVSDTLGNLSSKHPHMWPT